jgi:hypothetical protein
MNFANMPELRSRYYGYFVVLGMVLLVSHVEGLALVLPQAPLDVGGGRDDVPDCDSSVEPELMERAPSFCRVENEGGAP